MFEALERITDSYWNEDGYNYELKADNEYGLPAGYYSFDRPIDQSPYQSGVYGGRQDPSSLTARTPPMSGNGVQR